jgi:hypothetical protein
MTRIYMAVTEALLTVNVNSQNLKVKKTQSWISIERSAMEKTVQDFVLPTSGY